MEENILNYIYEDSILKEIEVVNTITGSVIASFIIGGEITEDSIINTVKDVHISEERLQSLTNEHITDLSEEAPVATLIDLIPELSDKNNNEEILRLKVNELINIFKSMKLLK